MKLKKFLLAILITTASLQAQVGIGTKTPDSQLDVNGDVKIGNEGKTDAQGKEGMMRWNKEKTCFEGHYGTEWNCLPKANENSIQFVLRLKGNDKLKYNNGAGWEDNDYSNTSDKNILKLKYKSGKQSLYDPQTGTITIDQDGLYRLDYNIRLTISPSGGDFDGTSGIFNTWITKNEIMQGSSVNRVVVRGAKVKDGAVSYDNSNNHVLYLRSGDRLQVRFYTYATNDMNNNNNDIFIERDISRINLLKL